MVFGSLFDLEGRLPSQRKTFFVYPIQLFRDLTSLDRISFLFLLPDSPQVSFSFFLIDPPWWINETKSINSRSGHNLSHDVFFFFFFLVFSLFFSRILLVIFSQFIVILETRIFLSSEDFFHRSLDLTADYAFNIFFRVWKFDNFHLSKLTE